ncbi:MAG: AtpZ/AtpI family protein [Sphingobacteriales bacterium]|jgi:F0F1-type ATP synthase assembly protein I|nr:AtpZ/AtpI family protein [Sphingobacteriales bacterium]
MSDNKTNNWLAYSGMAFEMFAIIGIFAAAGYFLDKKLLTTPFLLIILLMIGSGIAFYRIYKQLS